MAKLIPEQPSQLTDSAAEKKLFRLFQMMEDTDTWTILHSLSIAKHISQSQGEADFVAIIPSAGVFFLEVKGGRISHRDGKWFSTDRHECENEIHNPVEQANKAMHSVKNYIKETSLNREIDRSLVGFIQRGKRLKNADHIPGKTPYVSSTSNNNGVDDFIEVTKGTRVYNDCISIANSGSVGTAFYEPFSFVASDHVTSLKREGANKYIYLFLATVLEQQRSNFNFNREINDQRINQMHIMLPVDEAGDPDFQFMEDYIRELMDRKYKQYQDYVQKQMAALEEGCYVNRGGGRPSDNL